MSCFPAKCPSASKNDIRTSVGFDGGDAKVMMGVDSALPAVCLSEQPIMTGAAVTGSDDGFDADGVALEGTAGRAVGVGVIVGIGVALGGGVTVGTGEGVASGVGSVGAAGIVTIADGVSAGAGGSDRVLAAKAVDFRPQRNDRNEAGCTNGASGGITPAAGGTGTRTSSLATSASASS